jgi:hypothetical protein
MKTKAIALVVFVLASSGSLSLGAEAKIAAEVKAKAAYDAAGKAARAAEAAVGPIRVVMQKADTAYANARKAANAKRLRATRAKNLSGEPGVKELKQAEINLPTAIKALANATKAKPPLDKALVAAKAAAGPLQKAYDAAEKTARQAQAVAKVASDAAAKLATEARRAAVQATAKRRIADTAKATVTRSRQSEKNLQAQVIAAPKTLAAAVIRKNAADKALAPFTGKVNAATTAYQAAEKAALAAETNAKPVSPTQKQQAVAQALAKRRAADKAKTALALAQKKQQQIQSWATTTAKRLTIAPAQKKAADAALVGVRKRLAAAVAASQAAERTAQSAAAKAKQAIANAGTPAAEKKQATEEAAAWRKAANAAQAALAQSKLSEKTAAARVTLASKNLAEAPAKKKSAYAALVKTKKLAIAANTAYQAAERAAVQADVATKAMIKRAARSKELNQQAAADAAAKRKTANAAKAVLARARAAQQVPQNLANAADQKFRRATAQKKLADAGLASIKRRLASAVPTAAAAEMAAKELEGIATIKKRAADQAAAKRKAVATTAATLTLAWKSQKEAKTQAAAAAKKLTGLAAQKKASDLAVAKAGKQISAAATASKAASQAAQNAAAKAKQIAANAAKPAAEKKQASAEAAARRKAADKAKTALAQAQQRGKTAQTQLAAVNKQLAAAQAQKKSADAAIAGGNTKIADATAANQAARKAAGVLAQLDATKRTTAVDAAAKRKTANAAKAVLAPKAKTLEQALGRANAAAQTLARSQTRKKSAEARLVSLKKQIAAAKKTHVADEKAAKAAEAIAAPLKVKADKTRAAYASAMKVADDKRNLAERAKGVLYRLLAARRIAKLMESSDPPKPTGRIDEIVFAKLKSLGIKPALCSDAVFVRRAFLDLTGKLPSAKEAKAFIQSSDKKKRVALVDILLNRSAHADYLAMKWSDILRVKAEFPVKVWPNAAQAYHRWVWESIARNKPYDKFVRELLTSSGSNYRVGPVNFYRAIQNKTPEAIASSVGLAFMATRTHSWPKDRMAGMAVFFSQVGYKPTSEWKEEVIFWDPLKSTTVPGSIAPGIKAVAKSITATNRIPQALAKPMSANKPLSAVFPDGTKTTIPANRDPREVFADWLIQPKNPWFARAIVNRTWAWAMGRGIIHEPDDIRKDNPPSNPELLAYLEKELVSSRYDMKHLKRLIFTSTAYQFSSIPRSMKPEAKANFASYKLRRVEAEVLIDALNQITGSSDLYTSAVPEPFTYIPKGMSAVALADGSVTSSFLTLFGRSARATGMENERVSELESTQWLHMLNSVTIQGKLQSGPKLAAIISSGGKPNEIAEKLYLTILSRFPTDADIKAAEEYAKTKVTSGRNVWGDLAWALINSPEFLLRH